MNRAFAIRPGTNYLPFESTAKTIFFRIANDKTLQGTCVATGFQIEDDDLQSEAVQIDTLTEE